MPSEAITSLPGSVAVLAVLWVTLGRCLGESPGPDCDDGKVFLDTDLPKDAAHWICPSALWPQSQKLYSVDTVYDPEPPKLMCMNQRITYNHDIPNSGAFRPVSAESGEYLYCPPQRWINNLHHGSTVLLYHPCSPLHEHQILSALAQSCIKEYVLTPHKNLRKNRPIALVIWGRTLEVPTAASLEICDWLNTTSATKPAAAERRPKSHYNLLLTRSVDKDQHREQGSLKQCCEQTISSLLEDLKKMQVPSSTIRTQITNQHNDRRKRAALKSTATNLPKVSRNQTSQLQSNTLPKEISSQNVNQSSTRGWKENPIPKKFVPSTSKPTINSKLSLIHPQVQIHTADSNGNNTEKMPSKVNSREQADVAEVGAKQKDIEVMDLEEREAERGLHPAPKPQAAAPKTPDCACEPSRVCACSKGAEVKQVFPRTPRTDEAAWAAGALGFLLALLTLSILHTRLYRHWRRGASLYWHDPQQDYDSVADVIRRRLRLAKRRRKRGRKKEVVLLPSSSSSEEYP